MESKVPNRDLPGYLHLVERTLGRKPQGKAEGERARKVKDAVQGNLSPRTKVILKGPSLEASEQQVMTFIPDHNPI